VVGDIILQSASRILFVNLFEGQIYETTKADKKMNIKVNAVIYLKVLHLNTTIIFILVSNAIMPGGSQ
jgi:hypothetical protein